MGLIILVYRHEDWRKKHSANISTLSSRLPAMNIASTTRFTFTSIYSTPPNMFLSLKSVNNVLNSNFITLIGILLAVNYANITVIPIEAPDDSNLWFYNTIFSHFYHKNYHDSWYYSKNHKNTKLAYVSNFIPPPYTCQSSRQFGQKPKGKNRTSFENDFLFIFEHFLDFEWF